MATVLTRTRGILGLVGPHVDGIARATLEQNDEVGGLQFHAPYHITVFTKAELRELPLDQIEGLKPDVRHIFSAGMGGDKITGIYFVVIIWAAGQQLRKQVGLPPKQFHITLSVHDDHETDKGIDSVLPGKLPVAPTPEFLDHLAFTLHNAGESQKALPYCVYLVRAIPESHRGFLRLADAAIWVGQNKLAMLSYACAFKRADSQKIKDYCVKKLVDCSKKTEWGSLMQEHELLQLPDELSSLLLHPWSVELRTLLSDMSVVPTLQLEPRQSLLIPATSGMQKLPRFFRWLTPYHIAVMSTPRHENDIAALASPHLEIRHVLTLTEEEPLPSSWFKGKDITNTYLPIPNYHPPSIEQMDLIMRLVEDETKVPLLIHCGGGKGRAGTVAACYLAAYGFSKPRPNQTHPEMSATDAVSTLRALRPGSIETAQQEAFVSK